MTKNSTSWTDKIQKGHLPAQEAWQCLSSNIILKTGLPPTITNPLKNWCGELITMIKDAGLPHSSICRKFPLNLFHSKWLPSIRGGWSLRHARLLSNWNSTWIIIQIRDDRVSSSIGNRMDHYPCKHMNKHFLPRLWPICRSSSQVLDQESLGLCTWI